MKRIPARLMRHKVIIEPWEGVTAYGDAWGAARTVRSHSEDRQRVVSTDGGEERISATTVWVDPENWCKPGSYVTVWPGTDRERRARVISAGYLEDKQMPSHAQLYLE